MVKIKLRKMRKKSSFTSETDALLDNENFKKWSSSYDLESFHHLSNIFSLHKILNHIRRIYKTTLLSLFQSVRAGWGSAFSRGGEGIANPTRS